MARDRVSETFKNLTLILLLLAVTLVTAFQEGFLIIKDGHWWPEFKDGPIFWVVVGGGYVLVLWLAFSISTKRLLAFIAAVLLVEYGNQTLGTKLGLWTYTTTEKTYFFGMCIWVSASLFAYMGASKAVVRLSMKIEPKPPRVLGVLLVIALFAVIYFAAPKCLVADVPSTCDPHMSDCHVRLFWLLFSLLALVGAAACLKADARMIAGVVITAWIVGFLCETAGGAAGVWTFGGGIEHPPGVYLIVGCWPLEILAQFALSAWFAGERLVEYSENGEPDRDTEAGVTDQDPTGGDGETGPGDPSSPKAPPGDAGSTRPDSPEPRSPAPASGQPGGEGGGANAAVTGETESEPPPPPESRAKEPELTEPERVLKCFLILSGITYLVVGFMFALIPGWVEQYLINLDWVPLSCECNRPERLYVSMTFSMMMCITFLAFYAAYNIRKNKLYVVPLLVAKGASALSGLAYFIFVRHYGPHLLLFLVDGVIFCLTMHFFIRANMAFLREQTNFFKQDLGRVGSSGPALVAAFTGRNKFNLLDKVLEESKFLKVLDDHFQRAKKKEPDVTKENFRIAIKPNFMFMHAKEDFTTYTDPELVEHLVNKIWAEGYRTITIVESQSTLGNHYANRDVKNVAREIGLLNPLGRYRVADLTKEIMEHDYKGRLGRHYVGKSWRDAQFRISFAKNKTHVFCGYTLTLKNIYGTLPMQDKLKHYHTEREYDWPTIESMKEDGGFPVHFGLIDAFSSADGQFGVMVCPHPKHTKSIIGGENLIAVDWVGCKLMGMDPEDFKTGRYYYLAVKMFGKPEISSWVGNRQTPFAPWDNVNKGVIDFLDLAEEAYHLSNWSFAILSACSAVFPLTTKTPSVLFFRWLFKPLKSKYYKFDAL
ncbi:MAG: DUF362 domain-containing protein [Thermodesulfobacteriota bacterium]